MLRAAAILTIILAVALPLIFRRRSRQAPPPPAYSRVLSIIFLITLALMALSSIVMLAIGLRMHGWMLMLHMIIAPLFCLAIAAIALRFANRTSTCFRLVLVASFTTIVSALFMMMSWFGSDWQRCLLIVHRVGSMILLVTGAVWIVRCAGSADAARTGD